MSLDAWIIDELERERREGEEKGDHPGLGIQSPDGDFSAPEVAEKTRYCERGVKILDISPAQENVIDL